ncbi:hypothetical protein M1L60_40430 [Actinoplanes sp. TRM 88003]|uniref:Shikimate kinase n=1 Tax=Paractinoplanes aksuensis TaxID=2939490 RepID=A0ABT1E4Y0_9ACTN|nr:AAA family ATPase [Actinoplanes aksuensis]MCO8276866.1 hypothetical protein [Actinoplanes aksuensis]
MTLVWLTGNSGAGKSTLCGMVRARGYVALDADDDGFSHWVDRGTGEVVVDPPDPVPQGWLDRHAWAIDRQRVERLARESRTQIAFLCGSAENERDVREFFDLVICLVIDDEALRHRLATRTTNSFGRNPEELAAALEWNPRMRARYEGYGATVIDAGRPAAAVLDDVISAAHGRAGPAR